MASNPIPIPLHRLRLRLIREEERVIVQCNGRLVSDNTALLAEEVKKLIPQTKRIVLDLTELNHMDSSGLGTVVQLYVSARTAHCRLELVNINARIRQLLGITNLLAVFEDVGRHMIRMP